MNATEDVKTLLWVEGSVCDMMARHRTFVDLLALADTVKPEIALFTTVIPAWNKEHRALHAVLSSVYKVDVETFTDEPRTKDNALITSYLRSAMSVLQWVDRSDVPTVVMVVESTGMASVIEELYELAVNLVVYTDNPSLVVLLANMNALDNVNNVKYRPLKLLPTRIPNFTGGRYERFNQN